MNHEARRTQGEVIDFIEQRHGWDVIEAAVEEHENFHDDSTMLELHITAELELEAESDYRHDPVSGRREDPP